MKHNDTATARDRGVHSTPRINAFVGR